ncbi:hypothetical protein [Spirillospora sp. NPDC029432]|uniref:LppU/SCO3897 family protein n=1 Tax=Spirillospora sp. NPDC029432 TaxID=3154599 RepID=UPI0034547611
MSEGQVMPPSGESRTDAGNAQHQGGVWGCVAVLAVVVLFCAGAYWLWSKNKDHINNVAVGDCLRETRHDENSPYRIVPCDNAAATHKALRLIPLGTSKGSCQQVAGASRSATNDDATVCLGEKDVDPDKAVNVAKEGDCVTFAGSEAQRVDCAAKEAEFEVIKRLADVPSLDEKRACAKVPRAVRSYSWNWESQGRFGNISRMNVDVLLCLGEK